LSVGYKIGAAQLNTHRLLGIISDQNGKVSGSLPGCRCICCRTGEIVIPTGTAVIGAACADEDWATTIAKQSTVAANIRFIMIYAEG